MAAEGSPELAKANELICSMNELIISYLDLFDVYQPLQEKLCKHLSSANYASPGHRRYGKDYYDDRMKALKGLEIELPDNSHAKFKLKSQLEAPTLDEETKATLESDTGLRQRTRAQRRGSDADEEDETSARLEAVQLDDGRAGDEKKLPSGVEGEEKEPARRPLSEAETRDPIRWFGVLVPPPLRVAQKDFSDALEEIVTISTLLKEMDRHEREIKELRIKVKDAKKALAKKDETQEAAPKEIPEGESENDDGEAA